MCHKIQKLEIIMSYYGILIAWRVSLLDNTCNLVTCLKVDLIGIT